MSSYDGRCLDALCRIIEQERAENEALRAEVLRLRRRVAELEAVDAWTSTEPHSEQEAIAR